MRREKARRPLDLTDKKQNLGKFTNKLRNWLCVSEKLLRQDKTISMNHNRNHNR